MGRTVRFIPKKQVFAKLTFKVTFEDDLDLESLK